MVGGLPSMKEVLGPVVGSVGVGWGDRNNRRNYYETTRWAIVRGD